MDKLLNAREVAQILGIKLSTVYDWVHRKKIDTVKVGSLVRFRPQAIEDYIRRNTQ